MRVLFASPEYLSAESDYLIKNDPEHPNGESISFLSIFSHGFTNNIFGDSSDTINNDEIENMLDHESIHFSDDAVIFLGACNAGTGLLSSFAQQLANISGATVIGMVNDGVAVVNESTGNNSKPEMVYGPKYGDKYCGKFYKFMSGKPSILLSKEIDIIKLVTAQKLKE